MNWAALWMIGVAVASCWAQDLAMDPVAGAAGESVATVIRYLPGISGASSLEFDIEFDDQLSDVIVVAGAGVRNSHKALAVGAQFPFVRRILISGSGPELLPASSLSTVFFNLQLFAPTGTFEIRLTNIVAVDPSGTAIPIADVISTLTITPPESFRNQISLPGVLNGASNEAGGVAPGESLTIVGANLGPGSVVPIELTPAGVIANSLAGTQVMFAGIPAPLIYAWKNQVGVVAPYNLTGGQPVSLKVTTQSRQTNTVRLTAVAAAPAIFTLDGSGIGPAAISNQDGSLNSANNPAPRGSIVSLFATGQGAITSNAPDGTVATVSAQPRLPVTATVGGLAAQVLYAGSANGLTYGLMQVNIRVPGSLPAGGAVPVFLTVGNVQSQAGVTVTIQ